MHNAFSAYKPTKMWIDGKCFILKNTKNKIVKRLPERAPETKETCPYLDSKEKIDITENVDGTLSTNFRLPNFYYKKLLHYPNFDIRTLSDSTKTIISIPKNTNENIIITSDNHENVANARIELHALIGQIRDETKPLQFISIPTRSEEVIKNFTIFKEAVLNESDIKGVENSIFQSPLKLHLTIDVFSLMDDNEITEASKVLQEYKTVFKSLIQNTGPLTVCISGINCMKSNFKKVDVLYANAKIINETEENSLQKIVNNLANYFYEKGFIKKYKENVKVHVTLINTKYRIKTNSPGRFNWGKRRSFDATKIMEKYKDFYFGECPLESIHLSCMSSIADDGFYKPLSIIQL